MSLCGGPDLANLTLYLMLIGIVSRVAAEMLQPMPVGVGSGSLRRARSLLPSACSSPSSSRPRGNPWSHGIPTKNSSLARCSGFSAGHLQRRVLFRQGDRREPRTQLVMRIALLDGPLRDIQLFGFAALIIAGVSQRFVPTVYGLGKPGRDRQNAYLLSHQRRAASGHCELRAVLLHRQCLFHCRRWNSRTSSWWSGRCCWSGSFACLRRPPSLTAA